MFNQSWNHYNYFTREMLAYKVLTKLFLGVFSPQIVQLQLNWCSSCDSPLKKGLNYVILCILSYSHTWIPIFLTSFYALYFTPSSRILPFSLSGFLLLLSLAPFLPSFANTPALRPPIFTSYDPPIFLPLLPSFLPFMILLSLNHSQGSLPAVLYVTPSVLDLFT